ncbi:hypothetical protein BS50DRAFT_587718 [Corynespora cassiicola Philippines]|uniref:F-box domain-containing protein n=1 Tax=Corynespora cassiicola Philippines TaxID=1448308 RepID=A0A2T2NMM4_CORCC|nr:hypothetical protein BS50DRAFT_587718 [Corynespora cassiicola Philippines]
MHLDQLPEELIDLAISYLLPEWHESREMYELEMRTSLSKVSRKFRRIVEPHLYRNIEFYYGDLSEDPVLSEIGQKLSQVFRQIPNFQSIHLHNFTETVGIEYVCFPFQFHEPGNIFANLKGLKLALPTWNTGHILWLVELPQLEIAIIYPAHIEGIPDVEFENLHSVSAASKLKTLVFRDILSFSGNGTEGQLSNLLTLIGRCCPLLTNFTLEFRSTIAFFCHTRELHSTFTGQSWMRKLRELIFICTSKLRTVPNTSVEARALLDNSEKK